PAVENLGWAWVTTVRALGPAEAEVVQRLGVSLHEVITVLLGDALAPDEAQESGQARRRPGTPVMAGRPGKPGRAIMMVMDEEAHRRRLETLAEHLEAFEVALLRHDPDPYRGS
ncbi:MAG: hypothetical protein H0T76_15575, partial [Nannocystis sp.]